MIRAFVGLAVPDDIADMLEAAQAGLRTGNLVDPENFHVTLAFLGEQPEHVLEDVHDLMSAIAAPPLDIVLTAMGTFGDRRPRAVWTGVAPTEPLTRLRRRVRRAARDAGIDLEHKRFVPHVTLARFGAGLKPEARPEFETWLGKRIAQCAGAWTAEAFCLYRSHLDRAGPVYEVLAEYPLSASMDED